uniref:Uncharacterized protein n=1 Tax=Tanacetum cinerariifolium TaxID=118510 RepID=A0A699GES8_TANCI|nr:hypothetical protein [Tanacetum cinerariifolium]
MGLHQFFHQHLAGAREEIHLARVDVVQVFGHHADALGLEEAEHERRIALAHVNGRKTFEDGAAAEDLRFQVLALGAGLEQVVDQDFHRIRAVARRGGDGAAVAAAVRQHEVVHAAQARGAVADAGRHARAQHGHDQHVLVGEIVFARQDLGRFAIEGAVVVQIRGKLFEVHGCSLGAVRDLGGGPVFIVKLVHRLAAQLERIGHVEEILGVARKQQRIRFHQRDKARQDLALGLLVKINHHVAAEDDVELAADGPAVGQQVQRLERDHVAQFLAHARLAFALALALEEKAARALRAHFIEPVHRVHAVGGVGQHVGVDVGGDDVAVGRERVERFAHRHGDRIRLFAGGRGRAPDVERLALALDVFGQQREVVRFAEERRQVGGQRIGKRFPLLAQAAGFEVVQVLGKRRDAGGAQAARQAAVHHLLFAVGQRDAGALVDEAAHTLEVPGIEVELFNGVFGMRHGGSLILRYCLKLFPLVGLGRLGAGLGGGRAGRLGGRLGRGSSWQAHGRLG